MTFFSFSQLSVLDCVLDVEQLQLYSVTHDPAPVPALTMESSKSSSESSSALLQQTAPTTPTTATTGQNNHNDGTNTDSMVTVPLSDVQSNSEHSQPEWRSLNIPLTPADPVSPTQSDNGAKSDAGNSMRRSQYSDRVDATEDEVDWAELDKTEEQEPRGEGADEVC